MRGKKKKKGKSKHDDSEAHVSELSIWFQLVAQGCHVSASVSGSMRSQDGSRCSSLMPPQIQAKAKGGNVLCWNISSCCSSKSPEISSDLFWLTWFELSACSWINLCSQGNSKLWTWIAELEPYPRSQELKLYLIRIESWEGVLFLG